MEVQHKKCQPPTDNMIQYSNNRTKRFTVLTVLMVWMFALGVGWANACLAHEPGAESPVATGSGFSTVGALASLNQIRGESGQVGEPTKGTGTPMEVCNDGSASIVKSPSGVDPIFVAMLPPKASKWLVKLTGATAVDFLPTVSAPCPHVPLRTRFSRLVL